MLRNPSGQGSTTERRVICSHLIGNYVARYIRVNLAGLFVLLLL